MKTLRKEVMGERHFLHKRIWHSGLKLAALAAFCVSLANADQILYWQDSVQGTSAIPGAITLAGYTGVAASSDTHFDSLLTSQAWAAVIISIGNLPLTSYDSSILGDLTTYVNSGGLLIGDDYDIASGGDTGLASLFQATAAASFNAIAVTNDSSVLFNNIVGNIGLTNPGWSVWDVEYNATGAATAYGPSGSGDGIIEGTTGSGRTFLNGPLPDAFLNLSQGQQLIANEIGFATTSPAPPTIPEPGTVFLIGSGLAALTVFQRRRRHSGIN